MLTEEDTPKTMLGIRYGEKMSNPQVLVEIRGEIVKDLSDISEEDADDCVDALVAFIKLILKKQSKKGEKE